MQNDTTYGVALAVAESMKHKDAETLHMIHDVVGAPTIIVSTLQLALLTLRTLPGGKWITPHTTDIKDLAEAEFDKYVSELPPVFAFMFECDKESFGAAVSTVVMGSLQPLIEGDWSPSIDMETESLTEFQMVGVFAVIALSCVKAFEDYGSLIEAVADSEHEGVDFLRMFLPQQI